MTSQVTERGVLPIGIVVEGVRHQAFSLRAVTVGDQVDAALEVGDQDSLRLATAIFARQLMELGTVSKEKITTDLLLKLNPVDWNAIDKASLDLQKKLMRDGPLSNGGQPVARSSPATE